jgi:hypothetical protein
VLVQVLAGAGVFQDGATGMDTDILIFHVLNIFLLLWNLVAEQKWSSQRQG